MCNCWAERCIISNRRFQTAYLSQFSRVKHSSWTAWPLRMGRTSCSGTSVTTNQGCVNIPEKRRSPLKYLLTPQQLLLVNFFNITTLCILLFKHTLPAYRKSNETRTCNVSTKCRNRSKTGGTHSYISTLTLYIAMIIAVYLLYSHLRLIMSTLFVLRMIFGLF